MQSCIVPTWIFNLVVEQSGSCDEYLHANGTITLCFLARSLNLIIFTLGRSPSLRTREEENTMNISIAKWKLSESSHVKFWRKFENFVAHCRHFFPDVRWYKGICKFGYPFWRLNFFSIFRILVGKYLDNLFLYVGNWHFLSFRIHHNFFHHFLISFIQLISEK